MKKTPAALLLLGLAGCGTLMDVVGTSPLETPPVRMYGGVRTGWALSNTTTCCSGSWYAVFFVPDLPFSAILDTALLPITGVVALFRGSP